MPAKKKSPSPGGARQISRNFRQKTVRVYADEAILIEKLCDALSPPDAKLEKSTLLVTAAVEESTLLGFTPAVPTGDPTVTRPPEWKYDAPERKDDSYKEQLTVTAPALQMEAVEQAAAWAHVKLQRFFMGSLLRFAAKRKAADPDNPKLRSIRIPPRFTK